MRLPSSALRPSPDPSKPTDIHLPLSATNDNGRSQCSTPANIFGQIRVDMCHPIIALDPQASRSIARHQEVVVACLRSCTVEEPNIPVNWEDTPVPNFVYTRPTVSGVKYANRHDVSLCDYFVRSEQGGNLTLKSPN